MSDEDLIRIIDLKNGKSISIKQKTVGDVGCVVWDAALVLLHYLETNHFAEKFGCLANKNVVELGSGTGVVGIVAGVHKAQVTVTDLLGFVTLMEENITRNDGHLQNGVKALPYEWGTDLAPLGIPPHPDLVLFSDCVYYKEAVQPLVATLEKICDGNTDVVCSYEERTIGANGASLKSFMELIKRNFKVTEVPYSEMDSTYRSEDIHVLHMRKVQR